MWYNCSIENTNAAKMLDTSRRALTIGKGYLQMGTSNYTPVSCIYIILNTKNGKVYIGKTEDLRTRWKGHRVKLNSGCHPNIHLQRAWDKYGPKAFKFQILEYASTETLSDRERHHISIYKARSLCYNITDGGEGASGRVLSEAHRRAVGEANKRRVVSDETRRKISEASKLFTHSEESRRKIGEANHKRVVTNETKEKIANARRGKPAPNKGKPHSAETRKKISEIAKARPPVSEETGRKISQALKGKPFTEEHRKNLGDANRRRAEESKLNKPQKDEG